MKTRQFKHFAYCPSYYRLFDVRTNYSQGKLRLLLDDVMKRYGLIGELKNNTYESAQKRIDPYSHDVAQFNTFRY